jgi:zeta-carotene isomerase
LILGVVLFVLDVAWIDNSTGFGKDFISAVSSLSESPEVGFIYYFLFYC